MDRDASEPSLKEWVYSKNGKKEISKALER
jgi:hypothetical protein